MFGVKGEIEVFKEYEEGLEGMDGFSHLIIIAYLHKVIKMTPESLPTLVGG